MSQSSLTQLLTLNYSKERKLYSLNPLLKRLDGFLVSKEIVVLGQWESESKNWVTSKELIKVKLPPSTI